MLIKLMMCRKVIVFSFLFIIILVDSVSAFRFNVDPPRIKLTINRGEKKNSYVVISNTHPKEPIHIRAYVQDLVYLPDGSNDFLPPGTTPWSCADWINLNPRDFDLPPNKEQVVKFQVKVPPDARGGYYGIIFFEVFTPPSQKDVSAAAIAVRIGTIVLVDVAGTTEYRAELTNLSVTVTEKGLYDISCTVKNSGNVLVRPTGTVQILDMDELELATIDFNSAREGIFPGTSRKYTVSYNGHLKEGKYIVRLLLDYGGESLLGGQALFEAGSLQ